jgi:hypothetical protein
MNSKVKSIPIFHFHAMHLQALVRISLFSFSVILSDNLRAEAPIIPVPENQSLAHSHNDYARDRPLLEALEHEFDGIEADIFLVDGELLVGHTTAELRPERTLTAMYLEPLRQRIEKNNGTVYPDKKKPLILLIDLKAQGEETFRVLRELLGSYASFLTRIENRTVVRGAVTIVISGDRPVERIASAEPRLAFVDGRLSDLENGRADPKLYPMISDRWGAHFTWQGTGEVSAKERDKLRNLVEQTRANGSVLRFWGLPDTRASWELLWEHGVDIIGTDQPGDLARFMAEKRARPSISDQGKETK